MADTSDSSKDIQFDSIAQYGRECTLLVSDSNGKALDLSEFHIKFSVKKSNGATPNVADIRVYNLKDETVSNIKQYFKRVTLQCGYSGNKGIIFQGNIKQTLDGRENATDTFLDIIAGDGDRAYSFAIVNKTLAKGSTQTDQINAAIGSMSAKGVKPGYINQTDTTQAPRGKVMYGAARNYMNASANSTNGQWSIQDEVVYFLKRTTYLPGPVVVLNSRTGLIGVPQQTVTGINAKCLLNPSFRMMGRVQINEKDVQKYKIDFTVPGSAANTPAQLNKDGMYYILAINHTGDNRGTEWYTNLVCLTIAISTNPIDSIPVGY